MSNPRYLHTNLLVSKAATFGSTSALANYPATNLADRIVASTYRRNRSVTSQNIVMDLQTASAVNTLCVLNTNLSVNATLRIQAASTPAFSVLAVDEAVSAVSNLSDQRHFNHFLAASSTLRYWRLNVRDSLNSATYLEFGEVWLGAYQEFTDSYEFGYTDTRRRASNYKETAYGIAWSYSYGDRRVFNVDFNVISETCRNELKTLFETVDGQKHYWVFIPMRTNPPCFPVRFGPDLPDSEISYQIHNVSGLQWIEEASGFSLIQ